MTLQDNDLLEQAYPQLKGKLSGMPDARRYIYDDDVNAYILIFAFLAAVIALHIFF